MPDGDGYELVGGQLVERKMGAESSSVAGELYFSLRGYCGDRKLGRAWVADVGYQCFAHDPGLVRKPDVSFVRRGRLPGDVAPKGWIRIVRDLAVGVVSPNDSAEEVEEKLADYRKAGVLLVWVIYPSACVAQVHRSKGPPSYLLEDDELSGEDVIPGFRCPLREILPRDPSAESDQAMPPRQNGSQ